MERRKYDLGGWENERLGRSDACLKNYINAQKEGQLLPENGDRRERAHPEYKHMQYIEKVIV
jgi:hypothetical protein